MQTIAIAPSRKSRVLSGLLRFTQDCPIPLFNRQRECRVGPLCGFFSEKTGLSESRFPAATQSGLFSSQERRKESQQRKKPSLNHDPQTQSAVVRKAHSGFSRWQARLIYDPLHGVASSADVKHSNW
jgi:hypothetical protein